MKNKINLKIIACRIITLSLLLLLSIGVFGQSSTSGGGSWSGFSNIDPNSNILGGGSWSGMNSIDPGSNLSGGGVWGGMNNVDPEGDFYGNGSWNGMNVIDPGSVPLGNGLLVLSLAVVAYVLSKIKLQKIKSLEK